MPLSSALLHLGTLNFCPTDPLRPCGRYVIQRTAAGLGNVSADPARRLQVRVWRLTPNPNTPAQQAVRATFADAVFWWHTLPDPTKDDWNAAGNARGMSGINWWVSRWIRTGGNP